MIELYPMSVIKENNMESLANSINRNVVVLVYVAEPASWPSCLLPNLRCFKNQSHRGFSSYHDRSVHRFQSFVSKPSNCYLLLSMMARFSFGTTEASVSVLVVSIGSK